MANTNERTHWTGEVDDVHPLFVDCLSTSMNYKAMQVEIAGNVVDTLEERGLFSTVLHSEGSNYFCIALKYKEEYIHSNIRRIRVNFNRFNISFILTDCNDEVNYGIFRFKTIIGKPAICTFTGNVQYPVDEDAKLIEELKEIFYVAEVIYNNNDRRYYAFEGNVNLNKITIYELCKIYFGNSKIAGKITKCGYKDMSAKEFANFVDLNDLKKRPGVGAKTIAMLEEMYIYYGLDKLKEE